MKVIFTIVRHGETFGNVAKILQGHLDTKLSERGVQQAINTGKYFERVGQKFDFCFSSDLERTRKTGELIMEQAGEAKQVHTDPRLREHFPGSLQGLPWGPKLFDILTTSAGDVGAETVDQFEARLCDFWDYLLPSATGSTTPLDSAGSRIVNVLIVTHGGPVRRLIISSLVIKRGYSVPSQLSQDLQLGVPQFLDRRVGNCCISKVRVERRDDGNWDGSVLEYASENHLDPEDTDLNETNVDNVAISNL
ncbi:phosphoglycerate mutase-like protein [Atractiella rhizophila]|nr:phosphoglycerate mutase-like protein [Atractiella rhizophila]